MLISILAAAILVLLVIPAALLAILALAISDIKVDK